MNADQQLVTTIRARHAACLLPEDAQTDWDGGNHYEILSANTKGYWWMDGTWDVTRAGTRTEERERLATALDYACAYRRDVGTLLAEIDQLMRG